MFLFDIGIEHEINPYTPGQVMVVRTSFLSPSDLGQWRNEIEQTGPDQYPGLRSQLSHLDKAVGARNTFGVLNIILGALAGLKRFEELKSGRSSKSPCIKEAAEEARELQGIYETAYYPVMLSMMAIYGCFEERWAEPLRLALADKRLLSSNELKDCIVQWLVNTDQVKVSAALKAGNAGLILDILKEHSNSEAVTSRLFVHSIIEQCYENSMRKPLEAYLKLDAAKYSDFRAKIEKTLEKMGAATDKPVPLTLRNMARLLSPGQKVVISHGKLRIK
ncbi:MAG: hypothetical protein WC861_03510 [Candidatus Micrarchaeia archaeon]